MKESIILVLILGLMSLYMSVNFRTTKKFYTVKKEYPTDLFHVHNNKGYSIKNLKLCEPQNNIHFHKEWHCPDDITCVKCHTYSIKRHNEMLSAFEKFKEHRRQEFKKYDKNKPIVLITMNSGYEKILRNLMCSLEYSSINITEHLYAVPCEQKAVELLEELHIPHTQYNDWMNEFKIMTKFQGTNVSK